jgi:hypothetical protein
MWPAVGGGTGESSGEMGAIREKRRMELQKSLHSAPPLTGRRHLDKVAIKVAHVVEAAQRGRKGGFDLFAV